MEKMLAYKYDEKKHNVDGWWFSEKYNGVRGLWNGKQMMSRNGNPFKLIPEFQAELEKYPSLDGEIWFGYGTFDLCSGELRNHSKNVDSWKNAKYLVFDIPDLKLTFEERQESLKNIFKDLDSKSFIKLVKYSRLKLENLPTLVEKVEAKGGEGLMLRCPGSYYVNKRSYDLLKVKSWETDEAVVVDYCMGVGRLSGLVGSLIVKNKDGKTFKVGSGLSDVQRKAGPGEDLSSKLVNEFRIKENIQPVIGTKIVYKFKELTKTGTPLFPIYVGIYA